MIQSLVVNEIKYCRKSIMYLTNADTHRMGRLSLFCSVIPIMPNFQKLLPTFHCYIYTMVPSAFDFGITRIVKETYPMFEQSSTIQNLVYNVTVL